jgi:hypothetical protein
MLKNKNGQMLVTDDEQRAMCAEHFQEILNRDDPEVPTEMESEGKSRKI